MDWGDGCGRGDGLTCLIAGSVRAGGLGAFEQAGQELDGGKQGQAGHPAMTRLTGSGWAVAILAAREPTVPAASAVQGNQPDRRPDRRSASRTSEATISMPSTDSGNAWACQPDGPWSWASCLMWL